MPQAAEDAGPSRREERALAGDDRGLCAADGCAQVDGLSGRPPRLLLIEDHPDSAEALEMLLLTMGFDVEVVLDGRQARQRAMRYRPTLIVSDIDLPGRSGYELAADFREEPLLAQVPMIALTGRAQQGEWVEALEAGFTRFLVKPVAPRLLRDTICELIDRRRRQVEFEGGDRRI